LGAQVLHVGAGAQVVHFGAGAQVLHAGAAHVLQPPWDQPALNRANRPGLFSHQPLLQPEPQLLHVPDARTGAAAIAGGATGAGAAGAVSAAATL
jgi:hypothetical protein